MGARVERMQYLALSLLLSSDLSWDPEASAVFEKMYRPHLFRLLLLLFALLLR